MGAGGFVFLIAQAQNKTFRHLFNARSLSDETFESSD